MSVCLQVCLTHFLSLAEEEEMMTVRDFPAIMLVWLCCSCCSLQEFEFVGQLTEESVGGFRIRSGCLDLILMLIKK